MQISRRKLDGVRRIRRDGTAEIPGLMDGWYVGSNQLGWHGPFYAEPIVHSGESRSGLELDP